MSINKTGMGNVKSQVLVTENNLEICNKPGSLVMLYIYKLFMRHNPVGERDEFDNAVGMRC